MPRNQTRGMGRTTTRRPTQNRTGGTFGNNTTWTMGNTRRTTTGGTNPAPGYANVYNSCNQKIGSFRVLANQTKGSASFKRPTPATLNTFANWINKGAVINCVTPAQICRWTKTNKKFTTPAAAKNALCGTFGNSVIKAVTCDKNGNFLVATAQTYKGKFFRFPNM